MGKAKQMLTNWRVLLLLVLILLAVFTMIQPNPFRTGAAIRAVERNSSAQLAGIVSPTQKLMPMQREVVTALNNQPVRSAEDFYALESRLLPNASVQLQTTKGIYRLVARDIDGAADLGLNVYDAPTTNIQKGLDLQGGTRVILKPERNLEDWEMSALLDVLTQRLNVYGLSDIVVREASDLAGDQFVLVEIAGANEAEVRDLIGSQGKFEAKISNTTVFRGGGDITYICRTTECAGLVAGQCGAASTGGYVCRFRFSITLTPEAAQRQADATDRLTIVPGTNGDEQYLNESIHLFLDDQQVDELQIGSELKGSAVTQIAISGSGQGGTQQEAVDDALTNMRRLQTVLTTGSLPVKLEIVKTDAVSSTLGKEFTKNALLMAVLAIIAVSIVLGIAYRRSIIVTPIVLTMLAEVILVLGFAALIKWNIDMAAIAGIIVAVGTGVDDQIVITDETLHGEARSIYNWKQKLKNAFFIIMSAYATLVVAMIPLLRAGAGLLQGFAITTIAGVTFGVIFTRPAYAAIIEILVKE